MHFDSALYLFLKLNLWLCLTSILMVVASAMALSIPVSAVGAGIVLPSLLFYFIYVEDRRNVSPEDWVNQPRRTRMVQRYRTGLFATAVLALVGYELLLAFFVLTQPAVDPIGFLLGQLPIVVLAVYGHLKRYPTFDSIAVGATWAFTVVFAVVVSTGRPVSRRVAVVFLAWFFIVFAGAESRNVDDVEGDRQADRTTLASRLGARPTKAVEATLKTLGVVIFWEISSVVVAAIVVAHLLLLRLFRFTTRRADTVLST